MARFARAIWRLPSRSHPLQSLVKNWGMEARVSELGRGCRQRICDDRFHDCARSPAQCGGKGGEPKSEAIGRSSPRTEHQDSCRGGCPGKPHELSPECRSCQRLGAPADQLLPDVVADTVLGDKGYDADARVKDPLPAQGKTAVIPPRRNRKHLREYDQELYKACHLKRKLLCQVEAVSSHSDPLR